MLNITRVSILLLLIGLSQPTLTRGSDVQSVLDQLVRHYGGEKNLRKMDSMIQEWDLTALMGNRSGTDTRSFRAPSHLRVDLTYPQKSETRILSGDSAFVVFAGAAPEEVFGMQRDAMRLQLMRLYSPLILRDKLDSVRLTEDGDLMALSLVENGLHVHYMINKENWQIEKVAGSLPVNGKEMQFLTVYSDFKVVDGVLMHQSENKYAGGVNTAALKLRSVTFDASFGDDVFEPRPPLGGSNLNN